MSDRAYYLRNRDKIIARAKRYYEAHKDQVRASVKKYNTKNPERKRLNDRRSWLRRKYGVSVEQYNTLLEIQNGRCSICGRSASDNGKLLAVDHAHQTGLVRGLLCNDCNSGLGFFHERQDLLMEAMTYLENHTGIDKG